MVKNKKLINDEKIQGKLKMIESLKNRLTKEQKELAELQQLRKTLELDDLSELLAKYNMEVTDLEKIIEKNMERKNPTT